MQKRTCTLLEYGDYECPHCGAAYPLVKQIQKHFGKRLCFVFRNFPMIQLHTNAQAAAEGAEFAASKGKFWEMHDLLFENQDRLGDELFAELAAKLSLDVNEMQEAMAKENADQSCASRLHQRYSQRRERHSNLLHQ